VVIVRRRDDLRPMGCLWMNSVFARTLVVIHLQMTAIHEEDQDITVKKKSPDRIEDLVKEHLANIAAAEDTLRSL
jgi:hypothetical protein